MPPLGSPRYPDLSVSLRSHHPLAWVSATRYALRGAGIEPAEIDRFTAEAVGAEKPEAVLSVCSQWIRLGEGESADML
ncbi:MAG TPA: hypothetical protein VGS22_05225 [Thermoanaerobaculia bacterium]|nr:hypothetical protein [Thermoanaerobaculia bacterium]